ncbi:hypothetical protein KR222_008842 [Zaprionus bogoriensis]|nr:hypothetical protein KR222_008842 [Zaprionus bogoriensis]
MIKYYSQIVLACLLAVAYAGDERSAVATADSNEVNPDSFKYIWETSNGINANAEGHQKDEHTLVVTGQYEYTSPEGKPVKVTYVADENGYKPTVHV